MMFTFRIPPNQVYLTSYTLNPCADIFIPLHIFPTHGLCAMIALITTVLIFSAFIFTNIFSVDTKQDVQVLSPKDLLKNMKLANANKIVILETIKFIPNRINIQMLKFQVSH